MPKHSVAYDEYLASPEWELKRQEIIFLAEGKCERCKERRDLDIHHRHYESLGNEHHADLEAMCKTCHNKADKERKKRNKRVREWRGLNTYASKKYGEDWFHHRSINATYQEFKRWCDRKSSAKPNGKFRKWA